LQCHKQLHTRILPHLLLTMESSRHRPRWSPGHFLHLCTVIAI
jgi:hypothetical protein